MKSQAPNYKRTKLACYTAYFTMSSVFSLPPLLFVTLHELYGISYTLLGTLVLTNFCTQLTIDLVFTFFSKHFNIAKIVRIMPLITSAGMFFYALSPTIMPNHTYVGLLIGTVIFSVSAGLSEVLLSPTIAAVPSDDPQKAMSFLHSLYAFGVVTVVAVATTFLKLFGSENWPYLMMLLGVLPIAASVLFMLSPMPDMSENDTQTEKGRAENKGFGLALCVACIFFGSCAENSMSNWISSFTETALHIDKAVGDILGMAMFAVLLGAGRIAYSKFGKNISRVLLAGMAGSACCYLAAGLSPSPFPAFIACILTGLFTAMLWPGTLIMMDENLPGVGVAAYALMAAGGDLGASVAPQLLGVVIDKVSANPFATDLGAKLGLTAEQTGLKAGMLINSIFPILGAILVAFMIHYFKKEKEKRNAVYGHSA